MSYVTDFLTNPIFLAPALSWVAAQLVKLIIQLVKRAPLNRLLTGGGMPSSHTATVFGLLIETAICYGTGGFEFPMALFFAIMIIYDALNVRYVTGEQSKVINKVVSEHASDEDPGIPVRSIPSFSGTRCPKSSPAPLSVPWWRSWWVLLLHDARCL